MCGYNIWCPLPVCVRVPSAARSCAARDDNNNDNVCKPNIPAGLKCPPTSKTISLITRFGTNSTRLARGSREGLREGLRSSSQGPCEKVFYIGRRIRRSKAEELRLPPRSEEFGIPPRGDKEKSWSDWTGRRNDPRNETPESALRTPSTGVEATPRRARGSSYGK